MSLFPRIAVLGTTGECWLSAEGIDPKLKGRYIGIIGYHLPKIQPFFKKSLAKKRKTRCANPKQGEMIKIAT